MEIWSSYGVIILTLFLGIILILIVFRQIFHKKKIIFLILGESGSGKTLLFYTLKGKKCNTVPSLQTNHDRFIPNQMKKSDSKEISIMDFAGNRRQRNALRNYLLEREFSNKIIFCLDCSNKKNIIDSAHFLFELFTFKPIVEDSSPFIIACNKSDLPSSLSVPQIKDIMTREIEILRLGALHEFELQTQEDIIALPNCAFSFEKSIYPITFESVSLFSEKFDPILSFIKNNS